MASCGKNNPQGGDDPWEPLTGDTPISFTTDIAPETKTEPLSDINDNFRVFAFYQPGVIGGAPGAWNWDPLVWTSSFMYDQAVTYDTDHWTYSPVKYWPNNEENTLTFWAYSPYYGDVNILKLRQTNSSDAYGNNIPGIPWVMFTTDGRRDLLISDLTENQSYRGGDPATVTLIFHHTMCWVDFSVLKVDPEDEYDMYVKHISIEDIFFTAVHTQTSESSGWSNLSGNTGSITVYDSDADGVELDKTDPVTFPTDPADKVLPLPQRLRSTASNTPVLHVVYTFKLKNADGDPAEYDCYYPIGKVQTRWEQGKHYTYSIRISPGSPIQFTATVENWDSEQNGYFNVND